VVVLLERALQRKAGHGQILERCADLFLAAGEVARASNCLREVLQSGSASPLAKEKLAECEWLQRKDDEAARLLEEVLASDPLRLSAYDRLAGIRLRQNNPSAALAALQQALVLAPVDPARNADLIRVALRAGDHRAALDLAAEARKRFPYLMEFAVLQAVALSEAGCHGDALLVFDRARIEALYQDPRVLDASFFAAYGAAAERAGHYEKAAELLKTAIGLDPANAADSQNHLAYMWAELGIHLDEAEKLSRASLATEPDNGAYLDTLGWVLHRQGAHEEALPHLRRAAERLSDPVVFDHLGDVLARLGRHTEAIAAWRKALEKNPAADAIAAKIRAGGELTRSVQPESR
jgi:tetratricopeptide (TPR) repeat protein